MKAQPKNVLMEWFWEEKGVNTYSRDFGLSENGMTRIEMRKAWEQVRLEGKIRNLVSHVNFEMLIRQGKRGVNKATG